jgi:hypothetical protein
LSPLNQVLLSVAKAINDEIITDSGVKLYLDGDYKREWNAAVTATIVELPTKVNPKEKKILDQLKVGDEVCISFQVVADFEFDGDGARFMQATDDNPHVKEFINGKGEWIKCYAIPKFTGISKIQWVGVYQDKFRKVVSGVQGTESELERWLAQFPFGKTDTYRFNNYFEYNGSDYWKCNLNQIFAKKVDGHLVAIGDRVICKPIEDDVPEEVKKSLGYGNDVKIRHQDRARVITSNKAGIKKDYVVGFDPKYVEKYEFYNKPYFLIKENFIHGIWN